MWRPSPPRGTAVCGGFDGSDVDDWTALRFETITGHRFTPRYGPDRLPTIWNPADWGGRIPRGEVHAAVDEVFDTFKVERFYFDPPDWKSEGDAWELKHGSERVIRWETYRVTQMHEALKRYYTDLSTGVTTHDGCPITKAHALNARKAAKPGARYILTKPAGAYHQKIDAVMADVLAHEAACDARRDGWGEAPPDRRVIVFR